MLTYDKEKHLYHFNGQLLPHVTQVLVEAGFIDSRWFTEESRARGQAVHAATQFIDEGDIDWSSIHPTVQPYVAAYQDFKRQTGFNPRRIEHRVYNETYLYAGTLDREGDLFREAAVLDLKAGAPQDWWALQTAAYAACFMEPRKRFSLELKPDGTYRLVEHKDRNDIKVFLSALAVTNWKRTH